LPIQFTRTSGVASPKWTPTAPAFAEGSALLRAFGHGGEADLRASLADADADRTILLNLNEHLQRMTTDEMRAVAEEAGYELGADLTEYDL
jgi:hypothetical protein